MEYVKRYGSSLKTASELPDFVLDIKPPNGVVLAADYQYNGPASPPELEGDVHALRLIDLERAGLGEYRAQLDRLLSEQTLHPQSDSTNFNSTSTAGSSSQRNVVASSCAQHFQTGSPPTNLQHQHHSHSLPVLQGALHQSSHSKGDSVK